MKNTSPRNALIILSLLALVFGGVLAFAAENNYTTEPASFQIAGNSLKIMAERKLSAPYWVAGSSYKHGDMIRETSGTKRVYWNVSGTTNLTPTVTMPTHAWGDEADNVTNIWRRVMPGPRVGYNIHNSGTGTVWLAIGHTAVTNAGIVLLPGGDHFIDNNSVQDEMSAISIPAVTNRVTTQEQ